MKSFFQCFFKFFYLFYFFCDIFFIWHLKKLPRKDSFSQRFFLN